MRSFFTAFKARPIVFQSVIAASVLAACSSSDSVHDAGRTADSGPGPTIDAAQGGQPDASTADAAMAADSAVDSVIGAGGSDGGSVRPPACVPTGPEICNGKDDDCDGVVDNGFSWMGMPIGSQCDPGFGACSIVGNVVCVTTSTAACSTTMGSPNDAFHTIAASNGSWDWNCNNNVDRRYPLASCESFTAATCPQLGWAPVAGQSGDCGGMLIQKSCSATASGCVSTGSGQTVTEGCK